MKMNRNQLFTSKMSSSCSRDLLCIGLIACYLLFGSDIAIRYAFAEDSLSIGRELEKKRLQLEEREKALVDAEAELHQREESLQKKLQEFSAIRDGIQASLGQKSKDSESRIVKMVAVVESMQPKAASQLFEAMDDFLAVDVLKRMDNKKVAKMMNLMDKQRSAKLSELMTGYFRAQIAPSATEMKAERNPSGAPQNQGVGSK